MRGTLAIVVRFNDSYKKVEIIEASKYTGIKGLFVDEQLTRHNAEILQKVKKLRSKGKLKLVWTREGKIYIKQSDESPSIKIRERKEIERFNNEMETDRKTKKQIIT